MTPHTVLTATPALHGDHLTAAQYRAVRAHGKAITRAARSHQLDRLCCDEALAYLITKLRGRLDPRDDRWMGPHRFP